MFPFIMLLKPGERRALCFPGIQQFRGIKLDSENNGLYYSKKHWT